MILALAVGFVVYGCGCGCHGWWFVVIGGNTGVIVIVVFFFFLYCVVVDKVEWWLWPVVVVVANGRGGYGWCCECFLGSEIYYFIVKDILFCCNVYIILLC